jgi:uncharacterized membrane protein
MSQLSELISANDPLAKKGYSNVGQIISAVLPYVFVIAGLVLLVMLIFGGIGLMTSGGNPDKTKAGYGRIINALIGFLIIFIAYLVAQLVEVMLGVKFL